MFESVGAGVFEGGEEKASRTELGKTIFTHLGVACLKGEEEGKWWKNGNRKWVSEE